MSDTYVFDVKNIDLDETAPLSVNCVHICKAGEQERGEASAKTFCVEVRLRDDTGTSSERERENANGRE